MSTCRDGRSTAAALVTARQARDASKYFSVAPHQVLSCREYAGTLCYLSRIVYGLPTFYWENFFCSPKFPKRIWESRKHKHQNGVALSSRLVMRLVGTALLNISHLFLARRWTIRCVKLFKSMFWCSSSQRLSAPDNHFSFF
jgi:hypothetical protein